MSSRLMVALLLAALASPGLYAGDPPGHSVARQWNEELLHAIRNDFARPTVHARNLFHISVAVWDAWAAYSPAADGVIHEEPAYTGLAGDIQAAREEAISYAAFRILLERFDEAPGWDKIEPALIARMNSLGYSPGNTSTTGPLPAAVGNRIAQSVLAFGDVDGSNEAGGFGNQYYEPVNEPLIPDKQYGNPTITDPNRWQQLSLKGYIDQGGNPIFVDVRPFLSPEWGIVTPFALTGEDLTLYSGPEDFDWWVFHDPGPPPKLGGPGDQAYKEGFKQVLEFSGWLDPDDGVMIDISPASLGNNSLGQNDGTGYDVNPVTGEPYTPQIVPRGDYTRVLAEFWADGPDSETPPGHWFTILNYVSDHPLLEKRFNGTGPVLDDLEWDVKAYLALGGGMHDAAVSAWGVKGYYDYIRPMSAIRYMAGLGQSTDPLGPSYHPDGIPLEPGVVEVVTAATTASGERHEHLAGHEGEIAAWAWAGHVENPDTEYAGTEWILAGNWWPYQRPTFVTPPFAGYVSGHSTFSRSAAEILTLLTGSPWFPGGLGEFEAPMNDFLVFEQGPSVDITLQWAKYADASDQTSISRIYGGIHPTADDIPGRYMGAAIGPDAFYRAVQYFEGAVSPEIFGDGFE